MDKDTDFEDITPLLHFIDRLEQPLLPLNSEEEIQAFLASENEVDISKSGFLKKNPVFLNQHYQNILLKTRVLIFMFDKTEYEKEMKDLRTAARLGAQRLGIRYGLVTDAKLIRKYKAKNGNKWFHDEVQLSTIVIQRYDKETFAMDLMVHDSVITLTNTVNRKSLQPVQELNYEVLHLLDQIGQTVIVGMTDFASSNPETVRQSKILVEDTL